MNKREVEKAINMATTYRSHILESKHWRKGKLQIDVNMLNPNEYIITVNPESSRKPRFKIGNKTFIVS